MLEKIKLANFKCFGNETEFICSKINLLTGINGRGKSSLLQALLVISQTFIHNKKHPSHLIINGEWTQLGTFDDIKNSSSLNKDISFYFETDDEKQNKLFFKYKECEENERLAQLVELKVDGIDLFLESIADNNSSMGKKETISLSPVDSINTFTQFLRLHYISANRLGPVEYVRKNDIPKTLKVGVKGEFFINSLADYETHTIDKKLCFKNGEDQTLIRQTVAWLSYILDGANIKVKDQQDKEMSILRFLLNSQNDGNFYKPQNVGFGYSYVLPIIVSGLIAKGGDIFIVENPEAHIHPRAQSRLMEFFVRLAANDIQVFIESHSEHILNGLRVNLYDSSGICHDDISIYYFNENFSSEKLEIDEKGKISNWPEGFFDQQEIDLAKIFQFNR